MAIYRFRVAFEDQDDITRDIDIRSGQTFADFHTAIQKAINFDNKHAASFFVSDDYWRKGIEITLLRDDLEDGIKLMSTTKISTFVENPRQQFVYVYDKAVQWSFTIQLIKILNEDPKQDYPVCVKSVGNAPKQYKNLKPVTGPLSPDMQIAGMLEDPIGADDEAYKIAGEEELLFEGDELEGEEKDETEGEEGEFGEENDQEQDEYGFDDGAERDDY